MEDCLFCKIVKGEIPSNKVYEDNDILGKQLEKRTSENLELNMKLNELNTSLNKTSEKCKIIGWVINVINFSLSILIFFLSIF